MIRGDWVFHITEGEGIKITALVSTPIGDKTLGFRVPGGTDISALLGVIMEAEEDTVTRGQKFLVREVTDPGTQECLDEVPANVMLLDEWKAKKNNEKDSQLQAR